MNKTSILFYHPSITEGEGGHTIATIKEYRERLSKRDQQSVLVRDATKFHGDTEGGADHLEHVYLLFPKSPESFNEDDASRIGECAKRIAESFDAVGIQVEPAPDIAPEEESEEESHEDDSMTALKARATELAIHFSANIGEAALRAKIKKVEDALNAKSEDEGSEGGSEGEGSEGKSGGEGGE